MLASAQGNSGARHANVVDHSTRLDRRDAGCLRHGSRSRQIDQSLARDRVDHWAIGAGRAPCSGQAQQQSDTDRALNWRKGGETMASISIKIAILAGLLILTLGVFPDRRRGGILAIATCVAAALILHFAVP